MAPRTYHSEVRARAARETRATILRAAAELFAGVGYAQATVAAIAERAGVAVNTVYTSVGGKPALIRALVDEGAGDAEIDAAVAEILKLTDAPQILRRLAGTTGEITRRYATTLHVLTSNAAADPAVAAAADAAMERYRSRLRRVASHLASSGLVRTDSVRTEQILWFYFGVVAWRSVREFGWEWAEATAWLADQAATALLPL
nr:TetR/AcrR family transcriptional regulator [uncultured Actinoplanes sp.]